MKQPVYFLIFCFAVVVGLAFAAPSMSIAAPTGVPTVPTAPPVPTAPTPGPTKNVIWLTEVHGCQAGDCPASQPTPAAANIGG